MTTRLAALAALTICISGEQAMAEAFSTRAQAMDYIASTLPKATSENPKYLTKADGTVSEWRTQDVRFTTDAAGAVTINMREHFSQTKAGKTTAGKHEATFGLADVEISPLSESRDVTPTGEPATGVLFTCRKPNCVSAVWGDAPSRADKTDISIQDKPTLDKLLAAFRRLQSP